MVGLLDRVRRCVLERRKTLYKLALLASETADIFILSV
jgi:hypothetical protein